MYRVRLVDQEIEKFTDEPIKILTVDYYRL